MAPKSVATCFAAYESRVRSADVEVKSGSDPAASDHAKLALLGPSLSRLHVHDITRYLPLQRRHVPAVAKKSLRNR